MRSRFPGTVRSLIKRYFHIRVGPWEVVCPYFKNVRRLRGLSYVYAGKGLPEEIEIEADRIYRFNQRDIVSADRVHETLRIAGIGVDCSGFVVNILNQLVLEKKKRNLWNGWEFGGLPHRRILGRLRPRANISANDLTSDKNSFVVGWDQVLPGDVLGTGGRHVLLVEWVERTKGKTIKVGYVESNSFPRFGVQRGTLSPGRKLRNCSVLEPRRLRILEE